MQVATLAHSSAAWHELVQSVLVVQRTGEHTFRGGPAPPMFDRLYGGHLLAQALLAAATTVPGGHAAHSLHASYLRIGSAHAAVDYGVTPLRASRTFSTCRVAATQNDHLLAEVTLSFHAAGAFVEHQAQMPATPGPEGLPTREDLLRDMREQTPRNARAPWPFEIRYPERVPWDDDPGPGPRNRFWIRGAGPLDAAPHVHVAALAYASDLAMFEPVVLGHAVPWADVIDARGWFGASLDHSVWFHRPACADKWLLHVQESPSASAGRALTIGSFFAADGTLVATVAQELVVSRAPLASQKRSCRD
jgi:acyl-CoA thioesterase-2